MLRNETANRYFIPIQLLVIWQPEPLRGYP